jgi:hypothetical protein
VFHPQPNEPPDDPPGPRRHDPSPHPPELLAVCQQFLRTANPTVRNELREFLTARGHHPITGLPAFLDQLAFTVARPAEPGGAE